MSSSFKTIVTTPDSPRAMAPEELARKAQAYCADVSVEPDPNIALDAAINVTEQDGLILVCGSLYLVGQARKYIRSLDIC